MNVDAPKLADEFCWRKVGRSVGLFASEERMRGLWPWTVLVWPWTFLVALGTASILVAPCTSRHRFNALEVDDQVDSADAGDCLQRSHGRWRHDQVDRADDRAQRRYYDQRQHSQRLHCGRRTSCRSTCCDVIRHVTAVANHRRRRRRRRHGTYVGMRKLVVFSRSSLATSPHQLRLSQPRQHAVILHHRTTILIISFAAYSQGEASDRLDFAIISSKKLHAILHGQSVNRLNSCIFCRFQKRSIQFCSMTATNLRTKPTK